LPAGFFAAGGIASERLGVLLRAKMGWPALPGFALIAAAEAIEAMA